MNGIPFNYLNAVNASMAYGPPSPNASQMPGAPPPPDPVPPPMPAPPPPGPAPNDPFGLGLGSSKPLDLGAAGIPLQPSALPPPPPPAGPLKAPTGLGARLGAAAQQAAAPPPPMAPAPVEPGPPQAGAPSFPLVARTGAGVANVAAKETEMRGPSLLRAQASRNAALEGAAQTVAERQDNVAAFEFAHALDQENRANARQDAAQYSMAARADELRERQADFDQTVKNLSQMSVDPDRFYASRSTAQKIAGFISVSLGGLLAGRGMKNPGLDMMNQAIDRDIDAQKFAFMAQRDTAQAQQTAFSMAMQKYQNEDAATAAARAAAIDAIQAQIAQQAALQKGTDAENRATAMIAQLQDDKMQQVAQGVAFSPARQVAVGATFVDPTTGLTYNEAQARELAKEYRGYGAEIGKINATGTQQIYLKKVEAQMKGNEKADERAKYIANAERESKIPEREAQITDARLKLRDAPITTSERVDNALGLGFQDSPTLFKWIHGRGPAEREQAWNGVVAEARHELAGANVTPEEAKPINAALEGARDTESRMAALKLVEDKLAAQKANIRAGADDSGRSYDANKANVPKSAQGPVGLGAIPSFKPAAK